MKAFNKKGHFNEMTVGFEEQLLRLFGLNPDYPPMGRVTAQFLPEKNAFSMWLRADPAQWNPHLNGLYFSEPQDILSIEETHKLVAFLNQSLVDKKLFALSPKRWVLGFTTPLIGGPPPHRMHGQAIFPYLPEGDAQKILMDLQMLMQTYHLSHHPLPYNSVWFWGEGELPTTTPIKKTWGTGVVEELSTALNLPHQPEILSAEAILSDISEGDYVLVLDENLSVDWLIDLQNAVKSKQLNQLHIYFDRQHYHLSQNDLKWRLW